MFIIERCLVYICSTSCCIINSISKNRAKYSGDDD